MSRFFKCKYCGKIIFLLEEKGPSVYCCGEKMEEMIANTVEASFEKHIPVVMINDDIVKVNVGSTTHPMEENHYISWIYLETDKGCQIKYCKEIPEVEFKLLNEKVQTVYAYCNLHGLWKSEIN